MGSSMTSILTTELEGRGVHLKNMVKYYKPISCQAHHFAETE